MASPEGAASQSRVVAAHRHRPASPRGEVRVEGLGTAPTGYVLVMATLAPPRRGAGLPRPASRSDLRPDIQAMRALAVLGVFVYHANPARSFWERHGFAVIDEANDHLQMTRPPR